MDKNTLFENMKAYQRSIDSLNDAINDTSPRTKIEENPADSLTKERLIDLIQKYDYSFEYLIGEVYICFERVETDEERNERISDLNSTIQNHKKKIEELTSSPP